MESGDCDRLSNLPPSASVAIQWEPCRRWIVLLLRTSPRPDLKAPIHLRLLISGYCSSFAWSSPPNSARHYCSDWHGATFCLQNRIPTLAATSSGFSHSLPLSLPLSPPTPHNWKACSFSGKHWLFTRIHYHQIALKNKRIRRNNYKKLQAIIKETKMSLLKCQSYGDKNLRMQGGLWWEVTNYPVDRPDSGE